MTKKSNEEGLEFLAVVSEIEEINHSLHDP